MMSKRIGLTLFVSCFLMIFCSLILITTAWGNKVIIHFANQLGAVNLTYSKGSLFSTLELSEIKVTFEKVDLILNDVQLSIDFLCSMKGKICVETLAINTIKDTLRNNKKPQHHSAEKTTSNHINFISPIDVEVKNILIKSSSLHTGDLLVNTNLVNAHVILADNQLSLIRGDIHEVTILQNSKTTKFTHKKKQNYQHIIKQLIKQFQQDFLTEPPRIKLPINLAILQLSINQILYQDTENEENVSHTSRLKLTETELKAAWAGDKLTIEQFSTTTPQVTIPTLTLNASLRPPYTIDSALVLTSLKVNDWSAIDNSAIELQLQGDMKVLNLNLSSRGEINVNSRGYVDITDPNLPFTVKVNAKNSVFFPWFAKATTGPSSMLLSGDINQQDLTLSTKFTDTGGIQTSINLAASQKDGLIDIAELQIDNPQKQSKLQLVGQIEIVNEALQWQFFSESTGFTLPTTELKTLVTSLSNSSQNININPLGNSAQSSLTNAKTSEPVANKVTTLLPYLPNLIEGRLAGSLKSHGYWHQKDWSVSVDDINIKGTINNEPLSISGNVRTSHDSFFPSTVDTPIKLHLKSKRDVVTLQSTKPQNVDVTFSVEEVNRWFPRVKGRLNGNLEINTVDQSPTVVLKTQIQQLTWQKFQSQVVDIFGQYKPLSNHQTYIKMDAKDLITTHADQQTSNALKINHLNAEFSGDMVDQKLALNWHGSVAGNLLVEGSSEAAENKWLGTIKQAHLKYQEADWHINKPVNLHVNVNKKHLQLSAHCWLGGGLSLCLPNDTLLEQWGKSGQLALTFRQDLSFLNQFSLPTDLSIHSILSGQIQTQWSSHHQLDAQADLSLSAGQVIFNNQTQKKVISQWQRGKMLFRLKDQKLTSTWHVDKADNQPLVSANASLDLSEKLAIDATVELNRLSVTPFQPIIENVVDLEGYVTSKLAISGSIDDPLVNGSLSFEKGRLQLSQSPNQLTHINTAMKIKQNQATIDGTFQVEGNRASLGGEVSWQAGLAANINLYAESLPLIFPPQLVAVVSPNINFSLTNKHAIVSGNIDVLSGSYNIEKLPQDSVNLSNDVVFYDAQGKKVTNHNNLFKLTTDIKVNIDNVFKVSGRGLQTGLQGELALKQKAHQPFQVFGKIQSTQGSYQAYGQRLTIAQGDLSFNGNVTNPYVNLRASRYINADDLTVGINITGLADALTMQLFSKPTLETAEALSFLTRGRGLDSDNANAAASMLIGIGLNNSTQIFEQLEKIPLVNNITLDTEGTDDNTQAVISGYVGDRIYLKYGMGVFEPISELTVRLYLLNRLWLEVVSGLERSTDIYYSFDIE